jgi:hypothetical protein
MYFYVRIVFDYSMAKTWQLARWLGSAAVPEPAVESFSLQQGIVASALSHSPSLHIIATIITASSSSSSSSF